MQVEFIIRDWLVANPEFIERGLQIVKKEYYLSDEIGTNGFIDILCKDVYNNFVIVEIKRSDSAARQTFTEVFKYAELIRDKYKARDSEIKIIVISTHWDEIIRAFSFTCFRSRFPIKGLRIYLNAQTKIPESIEEVAPISNPGYSRKFMAYQILYLFATKEKRQIAHEVLNQKLQQANIDNYVAIDLDALPDKELFHYYAIDAAFQKQSIEELLYSIDLLKGMHHLDMEESEFEDKKSYQSYLEQVFIVALEMGKYYDTMEVGYAEKFESIIGIQNWQITAIKRYGIFKNDPRYGDDLLLKELKGHDGGSSNKFVAFTESGQMERLKEIYMECQHCLAHTPQWAEFISRLITDLQSSSKKFKLLIDIYNPDSIVTALYFSLTKGNPGYLPLFLIFVQYIEEEKTEVYKGEVLSFGGRPRLKIFTSTDYNEISNEILSLSIFSDNEINALKMGLRYTVLKTSLLGNEESEQFVTLNESKITSDTTNYDSIEDYILRNKTSIILMIQNYNRVSMTI
ncbi:hypothetical protein ABID99_005564 [Mucilaginibacter sp. OAE612]|uniref:endonuclease NucS domain-containing protein n=1 Tax=Mucilaginibacter sp. OAE612 TaxID=3156444 RepID=UPI00359D6A75